MSNDRDELRQHLHQTGHAGIREKDGVETIDEAGAMEEARPAGKKLSAAGVCLGLLTAASTVAAGALAWRNRELRAMAGGLLVELAATVAENDHLKSASGAGSTLAGYRGR